MKIIHKLELAKLLNENRELVINFCKSIQIDEEFINNYPKSDYFLFYIVLIHNLLNLDLSLTDRYNSAYYWLHLFHLNNLDLNVDEELNRFIGGIEVNSQEDWNVLHNNFKIDTELFA